MYSHRKGAYRKEKGVIMLLDHPDSVGEVENTTKPVTQPGTLIDFKGVPMELYYRRNAVALQLRNLILTYGEEEVLAMVKDLTGSKE